MMTRLSALLLSLCVAIGVFLVPSLAQAKPLTYGAWRRNIHALHAENARDVAIYRSGTTKSARGDAAVADLAHSKVLLKMTKREWNSMVKAARDATP